MNDPKEREESPLINIGIGMIGFGIIIQILLVIISEGLLFNTIGLWIGVAIGGGMVFHMLRTIEDALDIGVGDASKHMKQKSFVRFTVVVAVFCALAYFQIGSILTAFIGAMGLKISVYLQPYIYKVRRKLRKGG